MIEMIIAMHCAPALAGIKPANIVAVSKKKFPNAGSELKELNSVLNSSDIYFETLCGCDNRLLVMVYRTKQLGACLKNADISDFLKFYGYPVSGGLNHMIAHLSKKIAENKQFPHEIGAFLGYPLHDILGFLNHADTGCKLTGYWKVYDNEKEARLLFGRYDRCRKALIRRITEGHSLVRMFCIYKNFKEVLHNG